jgi:SAM-dependent methyltransferase
MALVKEFADFLVASHRQGTSFGKSITLGRQSNMLSLDDALKLSASPVVTDHFVDTFFHAVLGAHTLDALDYSNYQGANIIHDLNTPLPFELREQYDAVIDGGTLEHVFDFPTALKNLMSLLKPGGSLFLFTPANNLFGHGFYQFSPELFYSVLAPHNGFRIIKMAIVESYYADVMPPENNKMAIAAGETNVIQ